MSTKPPPSLRVVSSDARVRLVHDGTAHVIDPASLAAGATVRDVSTLLDPHVRHRAESMSLHALDLALVLEAVARLRDPLYPAGDPDDVARVLMFEGALIAYCRCFDSKARAPLDDALFPAGPGREEHRALRERRRGHVAHDSNGGRESRVLAQFDSAGRFVGTYFGALASPHVTQSSIDTLGRVAQAARAYCREQQDAVWERLRDQIRAATPAQVAALPAGGLRSPDEAELLAPRRPR